MERVTVAELKAKLSHYLRHVRQGKSFTVVSRDTPVAVLGPLEPGVIGDLEYIEPTEDAAKFGAVDLPPLGRVIDVDSLLGRDEADDG
jgi:prevent-host-death family protein